MLTLLNTLSLATALTLQPSTQTIQINAISNEEKIIFKTTTNLEKEQNYNYAFRLMLYEQGSELNYQGIDYSTYDASITASPKATLNKIALAYSSEQYDISKYNEFNKTQKLYYTNVFTDTITEYKGVGNYNFTINIRSTNFMEELLTALTTAVQSAVSIFVEGFGGLTQIFYNGTEITFIGGILIVGLAVMFLMMFLRWIVSFVKGI